jgi:hypothetical protein
MVEFVGRWSMLDVFVDTFTVALVQLDPLMSVHPGAGVLFFAAVVVLTMIAASTFDPRLIWDAEFCRIQSRRKRTVRNRSPTLAEVIDGQNLPRATLTPKRRGRLSAVWLIPLFAALVAVGIAVDRILNEGPTITILFKSAEGVEAGKTFIKYKDVKIGEVSAVELHDNFSKVLVTAKIDKHAEDLMVKDASSGWCSRGSR